MLNVKKRIASKKNSPKTREVKHKEPEKAEMLDTSANRKRKKYKVRWSTHSPIEPRNMGKHDYNLISP